MIKEQPEVDKITNPSAVILHNIRMIFLRYFADQLPNKRTAQ